MKQMRLFWMIEFGFVLWNSPLLGQLQTSAGNFQTVDGAVLSIEGTAQYLPPGAQDFQPLEVDQKLPVGSIIQTAADSEVVVQTTPGDVVKVEDESRLTLVKMEVAPVPTAAGGGPPAASNDASEAPPQLTHTVLQLNQGTTSYVIDEFPDDPPADPAQDANSVFVRAGHNTNASFFRVRTTVGVVAARGGSGYVTDDGEFGAFTGNMGIRTYDGQQTAFAAGYGVQTRSGRLGQIQGIMTLPHGQRGFESVIRLAHRAFLRRAIHERERSFLWQRAHLLGFSDRNLDDLLNRPRRYRRR